MSEFSTTALRYQQGGRDVYSFVMDLEEVQRYLPLRTADDSNSIKDTNRALVPSHTKRIRDYLHETTEWVMPAITLAATSDNLEFQAGSEDRMGTLTVRDDDDDEQRLFRIVDGQHRRHAIRDLIAMYESANKEEQWAAFGEQGLSVTLYAESDPVKIRQMFATMALSRAIDKNTQQQFDSSNPFNNTASFAIQNCRILDEGKRVDLQNRSLKRNSDQFVTHNDLKEIAVVLAQGLPVKPPSTSNVRFYRQEDEQQKLYERIRIFLDEFLPEAAQGYNDLISGDIDNLQLHLRRQESWLFEPPVMKLIAGCYYNWTQADEDTDALAAYLRDALNFDKIAALGQSDMQNLDVLQPDKPYKTMRNSAAQWKEAAVHICHNARDRER